MKILAFTTVFPGPGQALHGLFVAERLRYAARFARVVVISPVPWLRRRTAAGTSTAPLEAEYPRFFYIPGVFKCLDALLLALSALPTTRRLRRHFDFDLIDTHFGYPDGVAGVLLGLWYRKPVSVTLRGSELDMVRYRLRRLELAWALKRVDRVIAVSRQLAGLAVDLGADPAKIRVIENGVDLERFQPIDRHAARASLGVPVDARVIVSVGHLARVKGFELVVRAVREVAALHHTLRFVIVGGPAASSGNYPSELAAEIEQLDLSARVTITGSEPPHRVALWLNAADLFVLASEREGSPNALREALACGCPVVTTDVGDARSIVDSESGLVVVDRDSSRQWSDALSAALTRSWDRPGIRARAASHSWDEVGARVAAEWQACLPGPAKAGFSPR